MTHPKLSPLSESTATAAFRTMAAANVGAALRYLHDIACRSDETANPADVEAADLLEAAQARLTRNGSQ